MYKILEILINAGIVQGLFLMFLLKTGKSKKSKANIWLSLLFLTLSFSIVHSVYIAPHLSKLFNNPFKITEPGILLISPLLWLYILNLVTPDFRLKTKQIVHFLPFLGIYILFFPFVHDVGFEQFKSFLSEYSLLSTVFVWIIMFVQFAFYFRKILIVTKIHQKKIENELSNFEGFDIDWVRYFLSVFFIAYVLFVLLFAWAIHTGNYTFFSSMISLIFTFAIFFLGYKGLFQKDIEVKLMPEKYENNYKKVFENIEIIQNEDNSDKYQSQIEKLKSFLEQEKPYLNSELTLTLLAEQMQMSRNNLSELINSGMNENFYNLINRYRVDKVKELMNDKKFRDYTLLAIAYDAGFASKATFNAIFKKFTGLTPSEYRNRLG